MSTEEVLIGILSLIGFGIVFGIYFLPSIIAYKRGHHYRHIILIVNIFAFAIFPWVIAMIWASFPKEKSFFDLFVGNPTGTGNRNAGAAIGESIRDAKQKITSVPSKKIKTNKLSRLDDLQRLSILFDDGKISKDEYEELKKDFL